MITLSNQMRVTNKSLEEFKEDGTYKSSRLRKISLNKYGELMRIRHAEQDIAHKSEYYEVINKNITHDCVLFFDVDLKIEKESPEDSDDEPEKISKNEKIAFFEDNIRELIKAIKDFIALNKKFCDFHTENEDGDLFFDNFLDYEWTYSTDPYKYSYHIYFHRLIFSLLTLKIFSNYMKHVQKKNPNKFIKCVDLAVYHTLKLRCPYSKKSNSSCYHVPLEATETFFRNARITPIYEGDYCCIDSQDILQDDLESKYQVTELPENLHYLVIYTLENYFDCRIDQETIQVHMIKKDIVSMSFELERVPGCRCKKKIHKNLFYVIFEMAVESKGYHVIKLSKFGNPSSCETVNRFDQFTVPHGINQKNCNNLFYLYRYIITGDDDEIYFWNDQVCKWVLPSQNFKFKHNLMYLNNFFHNLINVNNGECLRLMEDIIRSSMLSKKKVILDDLEHAVGFNNGVYDIEKDIFVEGSDSREYFQTMSVGYDYVRENDMNPKDHSEFEVVYKELTDVIDSIKPVEEDDRYIFEQILGSLLVGKNKNMVAFFKGQTCAGKSTIVNILQKCLGDYFLKCEDRLMSFIEDSGKPSPNTSRVNNRRIISISEFEGGIKPSVIKKITENTLSARELYSNRTVQHNKCIYIVDTNIDPKFFGIDNAMLRRITSVKFNSFFPIKSSIRLGAEIGRKKTSNAQSDLPAKIKDGYFSLACFKYLKTLYNKLYKGKKSIEIESNLVFDNLTKMNTLLAKISIETSSEFTEKDFKGNTFSAYYKKNSFGPCVSLVRLLEKLKADSYETQSDVTWKEIGGLVVNLYTEEYVPRILLNDLVNLNKKLKE